MYKELCEIEEFIDAVMSRVVNFIEGDIVRFVDINNSYFETSNKDPFYIGIIVNKIDDDRYNIYCEGEFLNICSYYIINKIKSESD